MVEAISEQPQLFFYEEPETLAKALPDADYKKAEAELGARGMSGDAAATLKPWFAYMMLATSACEQARIAGGQTVLDELVLMAAKAKGAEVIGLETALEQTRTFAAIPSADQVAILKVTLAFADRTTDMEATVVELYKARKTASVWELSVGLAEKAGFDRSVFDTFNSEIIVKRNRIMLDRSLPLLANGRTMVAVGALHLVGETGLVHLYRQAGYTLTPVD